MKVTVIEATENPLDVISLAAGTCYGKNDTPHKRVANCVKMGHTSIIEHAKITLKIEGISRACMAQLTRHRMASYCVESQRYCRIDTDSDGWYVTPPSIAASDFDDEFFNFMSDCAHEYRIALAHGMKPEDARYLLPEATKTNLVMTMNCRELFHFLDLRADRAAQWEIRDLAFNIIVKVSEISEQWEDLCSMWSEGKK